ncbi:MAG: hypothetical protein M3011_05435 [Actinomycetota bacterium]|nr:hypothetical protein [Actinomycetota bacterium]
MLSHVSGGWTSEMWLWLVVPIGIYCGVSLALFVAGHSGETDNFVGFFFREISDSLRRLTGFPGWAMAGALTGLMFLGIAVMGFYWDVAWHIDLGRDKDLFTPAHAMILVGLGGLFFAAMITTLFASVEEVNTRVRFGWVRIPLPAVLLGLFGFGGAAAFPLDALWHEAYGIDVTLWSPTHLQLMAGGALATIAIWLMIAEALPDARPTPLGQGIHALAAGATLTGLTIFQGEFDYGVPQFQVIYLPILIAVAAGFVLVLARLALGPWGAVKAVVAYLVLRGLLGLMVGEALGHTFPRFPLYLPSALLVEAAAVWIGTGRRLNLGAVTGALVGSIGLVVEMIWIGAIGWRASLPPVSIAEALVLATLAGAAGGILGAGVGRAFTPADAGPERPSAPGEERATGGSPIPIAALVMAGVVIIGALAVPLPRRVGHVDGVVALERTGGTTTSSPEPEALVDVTLRPADAAEGAIVFTVTSWQGGGTVHAALHEVGSGHYRTTTPVPVSGAWKSMVTLERGDQVMAAPIYLPADAEIDAPAIPALAVRDVTFVRNTTLLLREQHAGPIWPALLAYGGLAGLVTAWMALIAFTVTRISSGADGTLSASPSEEHSARRQESRPGRPEPVGAGPAVRSPTVRDASSAWYASSGFPPG